MIELVIFDVDGTLVDTCRKNFELEASIVKELGGQAPSFDEYRDAPFRGDWVRYYAQYSGIEAARAIELYYERLTYDGVKAIPGAKEALEGIKLKDIERKEQGGRLLWSVASLAKSPDRVRAKLQNAGLGEYFMNCNIHVAESDKSEAIRHELREYGVNPQNAVIVGDTCIDIASGRRAGIKSIAVINGYSFDSDRLIREAKPDFAVNDIRKIGGIIE